MTKNELYKDILQKLIEYLKSKNRITEAQATELQDDIVYDKYEDVCNKLLSYSGIDRFINTIKYIKNGLDDTDDLTVALLLRHVIAKEINRSRLSNFFYNSTNLIVITAIAINDLTKQQLENDNDGHGVLEKIWFAYKGNNVELEHLWEIYDGQQHVNEYYLFTNEPDDETTNWRLYSYAYFCFVNESRFRRQPILIFNADTKFSTSIPYNPNNKYEQYFDAYNVMNESKFADDVLLRYLRMYQILEYFGYRKILADMTKGNIRENGFVRNIVSKVSGRSSNEFQELKSNLKSLLSLTGTNGHAGVFSVGDITVDLKTFIKDKLLISNFGFTEGSMWEVIYKLRNSIVHNKESELHFTYSNTSVYKQGIELMKVIIQKMEPKIVELINDPNITGLEFDKQEVQVY